MIKLLAQTELVVLYRETKNEEVYMEVFNRSMHVVESLTEMFNEYNAYMDVEAEIIFILNEMIMKSFNPNSRLSFNAHLKMAVIRKMSDFIDEIAKEKELQQTLDVISRQYDDETPLKVVVANEFVEELQKQFVQRKVQNINEQILENLKERFKQNSMLQRIEAL